MCKYYLQQGVIFIRHDCDNAILAVVTSCVEKEYQHLVVPLAGLPRAKVGPGVNDFSGPP